MSNVLSVAVNKTLSLSGSVVSTFGQLSAHDSLNTDT